MRLLLYYYIILAQDLAAIIYRINKSLATREGKNIKANIEALRLLIAIISPEVVTFYNIKVN